MKRLSKCIPIVFSAILFSPVLNGQTMKFNHLSISATNTVAAKPFTGFPKLFYSQYHPGITIGTGFKWKEKPKHDLIQTIKLGYFYHRYIQHAIPLYTEFGYRYRPGNNWGFSALFGAGYLHAIADADRFKLNEGTGEYEKLKGIGRPQGMFGFTFGVDYNVSPQFVKVFLRYQIILQTPFNPTYVPLLPYSQLHAGVSIPFSAFKKDNSK